MSDIVERLRAAAPHMIGSNEIVRDAADEIECLRDQLRNAIWVDSEHCRAVEADNDRLRAALEKIAQYEIEEGCPCNACEHSAIARAALRKSHD